MAAAWESERVAVIGSEEIVDNGLLIEEIRAHPVPHPLAVAGLKMVRTAIRPDVQSDESLVEFVVPKEFEPHVKDEKIVIVVGVGTAEVVEVDSLSLAIFHPLQHDDAVLHHRGITAVADAGSEINRSKIHQHEQLVGLESRSAQLVLMALKFLISSWRRQRCSSWPSSMFNRGCSCNWLRRRHVEQSNWPKYLPACWTRIHPLML